MSFMAITANWLGPVTLSSCNALFAAFATNLSPFAQDLTKCVTALVIYTERGGFSGSEYKTETDPFYGKKGRLVTLFILFCVL